MSLWLQSLAMSLDSAGDGHTAGSRMKRAEIILRFMHMPVPGSTVSRYIESGATDTDTALFSIMGQCLQMLHQVPSLTGLTMGHLLALSVAAEMAEKGSSRFLDSRTPDTLAEYVEAAESVLRERPDLSALGERIEQARRREAH